ncbi:MAG: EamA family transporter [Hyphomicrobiales bacterium]|nr:EamA family transporter [Hyphomicrobiales bacterium]
MDDKYILIAVLGAALLHATWNAILKSSADRFATFVGIDLAQMVIAALALPFVGVPDRAAWPYIAASIAIHVFYRVFLLKAYRYGDLSRTYPIARGSAPLLVAAAGFLLFDERISAAAMIGVLLISVGVLNLAFSRHYAVRRIDRGVVYALATGGVIASYSLVDAAGVQRSGNPLDYAVWLILIDTSIMPAYALFSDRRRTFSALRAFGLRAAIGGTLSGLAYGIVLFAYSVGTAAEVVALRETSIVFGAIIGAVFLKEGFGYLRAISASLVAGGILVLRMSR